MRDDGGFGVDAVEIIDVTPAPVAGQVEVPAGTARRSRSAPNTVAALFVAGLLVIAGITVGVTRPHRPAAPTVADAVPTVADAVPTSAQVPPPDGFSARDEPTRADPSRLLGAALGQLCAGVPGCDAVRDAPPYLRAARTALGPAPYLHQRTVVGRRRTPRAVVIAALLPSGAQLLIVASRPGFELDVRRLLVVGPYAVQSQDNGNCHVIVVGSGTVAAVTVLSRPSIQRWLAGLSL